MNNDEKLQGQKAKRVPESFPPLLARATHRRM